MALGCSRRRLWRPGGLGRTRPASGAPVQASVSADFVPDLHRIEARLAAGAVKHERFNVRHPEKHTLQLIRFDYLTEARASVTITADHDAASLAFRLANPRGFEVVKIAYRANQIQRPLLNEMAKLIVGQASAFV